MAQGQQQERKISYKSVQLFRDQTLGIGSYGAVCRAKCDDLLCAAKILHPTLFDSTCQLQVSPKQEHRLPIKRFEQECEFLSTIRHPNIVQYLCMCQDPDTGLPVLLMELMDESLTDFLESSPQPITYHIQVNICHDIILALSFLHSNGIVHRDLSSNNVLLRGNVLAKVTDFGMAKLNNLNPQATRHSFTMCPGTDVYMPPEAVKDEPVYTEKIDCFSFGVIIVQMLTRKFPKPGNRRQEVEVNQPGLPRGTLEVRLAEVDRRQNHISLIDPSHALLPIALDCLNDKDIERPSAQKLCERVASQKERPEYIESMKACKQEKWQLWQMQKNQSEGEDRHVIQLKQQVQQLQQSSARERMENEKHIEQLQQSLALQREEINQIMRVRNEREEQLESSEIERASLQERLHKLEEQLRMLRDQGKEPQHLEAAVSSGDDDNIKLRWREGRRAPFHSLRWCDALVDSNAVHFLDDNDYLWTYNVASKDWWKRPKAPFNCSSLTVLNGLPTTVGGDNTNKLMSLSSDGKWREKFPPMPTQRGFVTAVCTGAVMIVAGGFAEKALTTVEVLNIEDRQWSTAVDLPEPLQHHSVTVCDDRLYMLGGAHGEVSAEFVYTCSVSSLLRTCVQRSLMGTLKRTLWVSNSSGASVWSKLTDLPVAESTCVTFGGQLLAIGGRESDRKPTTAVYMYNPSTNSWSVISHMTTPRCNCFAAVLPGNNQLMVVGGSITDNRWTGSNLVEFGSLS